MPVYYTFAIVLAVVVAVAMIVTLVAMIKPRWLKINLGIPKYFGLTLELGDGPPGKEPGPDDQDQDPSLSRHYANVAPGAEAGQQRAPDDGNGHLD